MHHPMGAGAGVPQFSPTGGVGGVGGNSTSDGQSPTTSATAGTPPQFHPQYAYQQPHQQPQHPVSLNSFVTPATIPQFGAVSQPSNMQNIGHGPGQAPAGMAGYGNGPIEHMTKGMQGMSVTGSVGVCLFVLVFANLKKLRKKSINTRQPYIYTCNLFFFSLIRKPNGMVNLLQRSVSAIDTLGGDLPATFRLPPQFSVSQSPTSCCPPTYKRCTLNAIPATPALLSKSKLPFGLLVTPYRLPLPGEPDVPIVNPPQIVRCRRCRTYINPWVQFVEQGTRWKCNMCFLTNEGTCIFILIFSGVCLFCALVCVVLLIEHSFFFIYRA
jgi:hypothetical protein